MYNVIKSARSKSWFIKMRVRESDRDFLTGAKTGNFHLGTTSTKTDAIKYGKRATRIIYDSVGYLKPRYITENGVVDIQKIQKEIGYERGY